VFAWGKALQGQLGIGKDTDFVSSPTMIDMNTYNVKVAKVACGANHTVLLCSEGLVYFWGQYMHTASDLSHKVGRLYSPKLVQGFKTTRILDVAAGSGHSLALSQEQKVYAWGDNSNGQLGIDSRMHSSEPLLVHLPAHLKFHKISAAMAHSAAVSQQGALFLWGSNLACQLGYDRELKESLLPILYPKWFSHGQSENTEPN